MEELMIEAVDRSGSNADIGELGALLHDVLTAEGVESGVASLLLIDEEEMAALNAEHMGANYATDVLSFPGAPTDGGAPRVVGDVVLCPRVAKRQADEHEWDVNEEMSLLVVHGALHLMGYDHQTPEDEEKMKSVEKAHLKRNELQFKDIYEH